MAATNIFGDSKKMPFVCSQTAVLHHYGSAHFCQHTRDLQLEDGTSGIGGAWFDEVDLPKPYTHTQAVVMKPDTPTAVLRMAGGLHQQAQRSHEETTLSEIIGSLAKHYQQRGGQSHKKVTLD